MSENTLHPAVKKRYSNTPLEQKISEIGHIEEGKRKDLLYPPVPKVAKLSTKGAILGYDFSHQAKSVMRVST